MRVKADKVSKNYSQASVLSDVSLELSTDSISWFFGPSGSGKSTLMRVMAGLDEPNEGAVLIDGQSVYASESLLTQYRRSIAVVFQQANLFHHLTAMENIALPLRVVHKVSPDQAHKKSIQLLDKLGLSGHEEKYPSQLSGGQQQRVAIARALSHDPEVIFFDEPTSALDPEKSVEVLDSIKWLSSQGIQLLIVTHELRFARSLGGYGYFINEGRIEESGNVNEMFATPKSETLMRFVSHIEKY